MPHTPIATFTCVCSPCFDVARRGPGRAARRTSPAARDRIDERPRGGGRVVATAEDRDVIEYEFDSNSYLSYSNF